MKGCNTLTLCPAQMHEAVEFWLKNQLLSPAHAARVEVRTVRLKSDAQSFEVELREKETPRRLQEYLDQLPPLQPHGPGPGPGEIRSWPADGVTGD